MLDVLRALKTGTFWSTFASRKNERNSSPSSDPFPIVSQFSPFEKICPCNTAHWHNKPWSITGTIFLPFKRRKNRTDHELENKHARHSHCLHHCRSLKAFLFFRFVFSEEIIPLHENSSNYKGEQTNKHIAFPGTLLPSMLRLGRSMGGPRRVG